MSETNGDRGAGKTEGSTADDDKVNLKNEKRERLEGLFEKYGSVSSRPVTAEYLAGFLDGEGSFYIRTDRNRYKYPRISSGQFSGHGISDIKRDWGGILGKNTTGCIVELIWSSREDVMYILQATLPYLRLKKRQAELILEYFDADPGRRKEIVDVFKTINQRETWG